MLGQAYQVRHDGPVYTGPFPQQEPGPAHPAEWPGAEPQQDVSPGPGMPWDFAPERLEWADSILRRFELPQDPHANSWSERDTRTSLITPQSTHRKS